MAESLPLLHGQPTRYESNDLDLESAPVHSSSVTDTPARSRPFLGLLLLGSLLFVGGLLYTGRSSFGSPKLTLSLSEAKSARLSSDAYGAPPGSSPAPSNAVPVNPSSVASPAPSPQVILSSPPTSVVQVKPINPEVEFLGPTDKATAIKKGSLVGSGIALPDDFQVQFDFQGLLAQTGISNILHVTSGTGSTDEYSEQCTPCAYWLENGKLWLQWSIYKGGVGSVTTNTNLRASEWYTIYLSPIQSKYNMLFEVYDSKNTLVDSGNFNFNSQMSSTSRSAYIYASDQFVDGANGNIKNIIFREYTYAPTKAPTFAPTYYIKSKPINPEVEFLGPKVDGTTITKGQVVGYGIALPDDFQVQFDYYPGVASTGTTNILHVTSGTGDTTQESKQCTPCAYALESSQLFLQWSIYKAGYGTVTTNVKLPAEKWYTIYLSPRQTLYNMLWEIYDSSSGTLVDSGDMNFNAQMSSTSRDVYVYASDKFSDSANGQVRNIIFREYTNAPTKRPSALPTFAPTPYSDPINPEKEFLGPTEQGTKLVTGSLVGSGIALPDEYQVEFTYMPFAIESSQNNILHTTSYLGTGQDAQEQEVPAVYTSSTNPGALYIEWQVYKSGKASVTTNRALAVKTWYQVFITISQPTFSITVEIYDMQGNEYDRTDFKINSQMDKAIRNAYVYASNSFSAAANGQIRNIIYREYKFRPTQKPTFRPSALPSPQPTDKPSALPTNKPTDRPSYEPTFEPSAFPTHEPTDRPTDSPTFRPTTLEPTVVHGTAQPTYGMRPINPEVEFLGPSEHGTAVSRGNLAGSGIALPDDFQVQFEYYPNSLAHNANNILYVTTQADQGEEARGNMVPSVFSSKTGSLQIQWEVVGEGRARVITSKALVTGSWHTVVLSVMMSRMDMMVEIYDGEGNLFDSADMPFNAQLGKGSRSVWVWASNQWDDAADGQIRNVILREISSMPTDFPTPTPTDRPTHSPSAVPTERPSAIPTHTPSWRPTNEPTKEPTFEPTFEPSDRPTNDPTGRPTFAPSSDPTERPTHDPTHMPSDFPSTEPSYTPTHAPTHRPSNRPSHSPTEEPSDSPTERPTTVTDPPASPSFEPTHKPTESPTMEPTEKPTDVPTYKPTDQPTLSPTFEPTSDPTHEPSAAPTEYPSFSPTEWPSALPTEGPTPVPSDSPSQVPTQKPSFAPTDEPTFVPSERPSPVPSSEPTDVPTQTPTDHPTFKPSNEPTEIPTHTPTEQPTIGPTDRVSSPTEDPSQSPTHSPSHTPTHSPTDEPTAYPTDKPTEKPSFQPTEVPTKTPSFAPSDQPSLSPTEEPTQSPSESPSMDPTESPTVRPTKEPSYEPTAKPSRSPTFEPTNIPTEKPTDEPSPKPTFQPTMEPSFGPTEVPTFQPTHKPTDSQQPLASGEPTTAPSHTPSYDPTVAPSEAPTHESTHTPSSPPTFKPSSFPSYEPSKLPTRIPSDVPSEMPSTYPSFGPTDYPTTEPTHTPTESPTSGPSELPTAIPTHTPSKFPTWAPSEEPTTKPSRSPSEVPTTRPSDSPTFKPTHRPTDSDVKVRTGHPSAIPTHEPTEKPTRRPTDRPTIKPTNRPSLKPSTAPTEEPTPEPSLKPTIKPSATPTDRPSRKPTHLPTIINRHIHSPTQEPTVMHSKVSEGPTPRPDGMSDDDKIYTYDDDWTYGDEPKSSRSSSGKNKKSSSLKSKSNKKNKKSKDKKTKGNSSSKN